MDKKALKDMLKCMEEEDKERDRNADLTSQLQDAQRERDESTERHKRELVICLRAMDGLEAERDALRAENHALFDTLRVVADCPTCGSCGEMAKHCLSLSAPLTTAAAERWAAMERVLSEERDLCKGLAGISIQAISTYCREWCEDESECDECPLNMERELDNAEDELKRLLVALSALQSANGGGEAPDAE